MVSERHPCVLLFSFSAFRYLLLDDEWPAQQMNREVLELIPALIHTTRNFMFSFFPNCFASRPVSVYRVSIHTAEFYPVYLFFLSFPSLLPSRLSFATVHDACWNHEDRLLRLQYGKTVTLWIDFCIIIDFAVIQIQLCLITPESW